MTQAEHHEHEAVGLMWSDRSEIAVAPALEQGHALEVTIHEILHAVWKQMCAPEHMDRALEESVVQRLGVGLATVFRDNPRLLKWIGEMTGARSG